MSMDAETIFELLKILFRRGKDVEQTRNRRDNACSGRGQDAISRAMDAMKPRLAVIRQCFGSGMAADGQTAYKARPS